MYIAHPTHGAGTRPNRTQPPTAARKTTLNAGQCVRQPGKAGGGTGSPPPPEKKKEGGGGGAQKQPTVTKPPANTTRGGRTPPPEGTKHRTPEEARGDHQAKTGNTKQRPTGKRDTETCRHTPRKKKKSQQPSPKERGWGDRDHKARDRDSGQRKKSAKNTPRQPSHEGLGTAETRAQHARPHRTPELETAGGKRGTHEATHVP